MIYLLPSVTATGAECSESLRCMLGESETLTFSCCCCCCRQYLRELVQAFGLLISLVCSPLLLSSKMSTSDFWKVSVICSQNAPFKRVFFFPSALKEVILFIIIYFFSCCWMLVHVWERERVLWSGRNQALKVCMHVGMLLCVHVFTAVFHFCTLFSPSPFDIVSSVWKVMTWSGFFFWNERKIMALHAQSNFALMLFSFSVTKVFVNLAFKFMLVSTTWRWPVSAVWKCFFLLLCV